MRPFLLLPVLLASTALAQKVIIEYDHSIDFSAWRQYEWKEHPWLRNRPESKQFRVGTALVQNYVNVILMKRGYQPVDEHPQIFITHFITARLGQDTYSVPSPASYNNGYMWPGSWYSWNSAWFPAWDTYVENYVSGILLLDVVDAKTNRLLWRAASKAKIEDMTERHKDIEDVVKKALKAFPPKFKEP